MSQCNQDYQAMSQDNPNSVAEQNATDQINRLLIDHELLLQCDLESAIQHETDHMRLVRLCCLLAAQRTYDVEMHRLVREANPDIKRD